MNRTPGFVVPSSFSSSEELKQEVKRRAKEAGYTTFDFSTFTTEAIEHEGLLVDEFLQHYGVRGMKWGKRNSKSGSTIPRSTQRAANSDAKEYAQAKMYFGEGAGIRRRQINAKVTQRSKDPAYKEAFEKSLDAQDMAKAGAKARGQRKRTDAVKGTKKTAKGIHHILNGNSQYANAAAAILVGGAMYAHKTGIDKMLLDKGKTLLNDPKFRKQSSDIFDQIKNFKG